MSKRLQKRRIDDNLRQLVLIRQDRGLVNESTCFFTCDSEFLFYFLLFQKKWVGRAMGNETFYGDGLRACLHGGGVGCRLTALPGLPGED